VTGIKKAEKPVSAFQQEQFRLQVRNPRRYFGINLVSAGFL
jgi:hypothetical protein